jgi:AraC-like DNA-binding protein
MSMSSIKFDILPAPGILRSEVECIRVIAHRREEGVAIKVFPNGLPGIVFQHDNGNSALENIITPSHTSRVPTSFLYGPGTEPSIMNFKKGSYASIQVVFKPQALNTLLGLNASALTNGFAELNEFSTEDLNLQLMEAGTERKRVTLLTDFLFAKLKQSKSRDPLVEESLHLIHQNITFIDVKHLLKRLAISERQFERRFSQTVGIAPQAYIRVKRFNEAIRLMKTRQYTKLTDIAYALNFHDQSHFIRDAKAFSGLTPKSISQKVENFQDQSGLSYI